jgi:hypothetical protein
MGEAQVSDTGLGTRDGLVHCSADGCDATVPDHYWGKVKAAGWFFQRNGDAWCPEHVPEWVAEWRSRQ